MTLQLPETLKEAIVVCTDLLLAAFFTLLALLVSTYHLLPEFFGPSCTHQLPRNFEELNQCDGTDPNTPVDSSDSSTTSSIILAPSRPYDVFLSFRGLDTRNNITGHLYNYLVQKGLLTFIDDEELRKGEEISSALLKAIQGSKISILIFSENYASSRWCLDELVEILRCKEQNQQLVWSVFYKVDPADVRWQKGQYAKHFAIHESKFKDKMDKVKRWRMALRDAANKSGWHLPVTGHEPTFVRDLAEAISAEVSKCRYMNVATYPIGIECRLRDMLNILDVERRDVTMMVGMWGMGGIGGICKTTLAKAIYNSICHMFEGSCFLSNVRAASLPDHGLVGLQNLLLHEILGGKKMKMNDVDRGIEEIKNRLGSKRVLIVLDDVNELNQLDKLAGGLEWFGQGSRVIITTRDTQVLKAHQDYSNPIYKVEVLNKDEARTLLISNAFKGNLHPDASWEFPIDTALGYCHGLPLAINVLGSLLSGKKLKKWIAILDDFSKSPNGEIQTILGRSYLMLKYPSREAFRDIACFLKDQQSLEYVMQALDGSRLNPEYALDVLEDRALINISENGKILMHDLLEEMGKGIVYSESPNDAGKRSRLWFYKDVYTVLTEGTGSGQVKGIKVELSRKDEICLRDKCFEKMKNLELFININADFSGEVNYLPNTLRFLDWPGFPAQSLPAYFNPQELVMLHMPNSSISRFGKAFKLMRTLKSLNLKGCKFLTEIPDLSGTPNLKELNLIDCAKLVEMHPSVGLLDKLAVLHMDGCGLKTFPRMVKMKSLEKISFQGCKRLENFPEIEGRMEFLWAMDLSGTSITEVPSSIAQVINLQELILRRCTNLTTISVDIYELQHLYHLDIGNCPKLVLTPFSNEVQYGEASSSNMSRYGEPIPSERFGDPYDQGNLLFPSLISCFRSGCNISDICFLEMLSCSPTFRVLDLSFSDFVRLPAGLTKSMNLCRLSLHGCKMLQEVPKLPSSLVDLDVGDCVSLERISKLSDILKGTKLRMFRRMNLSNCHKLCDNLVQEAHLLKGLNNDDHPVEADFFSFLMSCQYTMTTAFKIILPLSLQIPKWFSFQLNNGEYQAFVIDIQAPALGNIFTVGKGLALCVSGKNLNYLEYKIFINGVLMERVVGEEDAFDDFLFNKKPKFPSGRLDYIPFNNLVPDRSESTIPRPPFQCRVALYATAYRMKSSKIFFGVHLVIPPNEVNENIPLIPVTYG